MKDRVREHYRIRHRIILRVLLLSFVGAASVYAPAGAQNAIDFTLPDLDGVPLRLSDYHGEKVVLINFWATWCQPCIKEFPHLQALHDRYGGEGLEVLAISVDGPATRSQVQGFIERHNYSFTVLHDIESKVLALYNPRVILPYTVLIGRDGVIHHVHQGYSPGDEVILEERVTELLGAGEVGGRRLISYQLDEAITYRGFSDGEYVDLERGGRSSQVINQLDLSLARRELLIGIRFDSDLDYSPLKSRYTLAKGFLEIDRENLNLRLGDFYYSVGRGLSVSILKIFEEEGLEYVIDTTIRGGKAVVKRGSISAEIFGGEIEREEAAEKDNLWGGTVKLGRGGSSNIHFTYLRSHLAAELFSRQENVSIQTVGLGVPVMPDMARLSAEFSLLQGEDESTGEKRNGHGLYIESGLYLDNLSLLLELKHYRNFDFRYGRPPTLESEELDIMASHFDTGVDDIYGASARLDYRFPDTSTLVYGKLSGFYDRPYDLPAWRERRRSIVHYLAGFERYFGDAGYVTALAGYRTEENPSSVSFLDNDTVHYQFNISYPLNRGLSLEADLKQKRVKGVADYVESRYFLSLHYSSRGILTVFLDRTDDPEVTTFEERKEWWAGQLELRLSSANSLRLFWGASKGAVKCSGGICRYFPPFDGLKLEAILRM